LTAIATGEDVPLCVQEHDEQRRDPPQDPVEEHRQAEPDRGMAEDELGRESGSGVRLAAPSYLACCTPPPCVVPACRIVSLDVSMNLEWRSGPVAVRRQRDRSRTLARSVVRTSFTRRYRAALTVRS